MTDTTHAQGQAQGASIANEVHQIHQRLNHHDKVLDRIGDVLVKQAEMTQQIISTNDSLAEFKQQVDQRLDKMDQRVEENRSTVTRWSGGLALLVVAGGIGGTIVANLI